MIAATLFVIIVLAVLVGIVIAIKRMACKQSWRLNSNDESVCTKCGAKAKDYIIKNGMGKKSTAS